MIARFFLLCCAVFLLTDCAAPRRSERVFAKKLAREVERSPVFSQAFTGFVLADAETGRLFAASNADKFFTPASNTKILTLYACLRVLGDSLPSLQHQPYEIGGDDSQQTVRLVQGCADPTFLHPAFQAWQAGFDFLKKQADSIIIVPRRFEDKRFGPGWAWDDYNDDYQAEKTAMPAYGNVLRLRLDKNKMDVQPPFFRRNVLQTSLFSPESPIRAETRNLWAAPVFSQKDLEYELPFLQPDLGELLTDTLRKPVGAVSAYGFEYIPPHAWRTIYACPVDTVYRRLMHQSDNFVAEQLLLACAGEKFGILRQDTLLRWAQDSLLAGLPQRPKWVDGSGLSRYNLNTPRNNVEILRRLWREQPRARLFDLFPAGGASGTLAAWFAPAAGQPPYVFAKTGSLSGVFCLSGYVVCRSGRVLAFSFMHNNFVGSNRPWKAETQRFLEEVRDGF